MGDGRLPLFYQAIDDIHSIYSTRFFVAAHSFKIRTREGVRTTPETYYGTNEVLPVLYEYVPVWYLL
jgi:hypothetical protein